MLAWGNIAVLFCFHIVHTKFMLVVIMYWGGCDYNRGHVLLLPVSPFIINCNCYLFFIALYWYTFVMLMNPQFNSDILIHCSQFRFKLFLSFFYQDFSLSLGLDNACRTNYGGRRRLPPVVGRTNYRPTAPTEYLPRPLNFRVWLTANTPSKHETNNVTVAYNSVKRYADVVAKYKFRTMQLNTLKQCKRTLTL